MPGRASCVLILLVTPLLCAQVHEALAHSHLHPLTAQLREESARGPPDGAWTQWLLANARHLMVSLPKPLRGPPSAFVQRLLPALHQRAEVPICVVSTPRHLDQRPRSMDAHLILLDDDQYLADFLFNLKKDSESYRAGHFHALSHVMFIFLHEYICPDDEDHWHTVLRFASWELSIFKAVWMKKNLGMCARIYPDDLLYFYDSFTIDSSLLAGLMHAPNTVNGVENLIRFHSQILDGRGYQYVNVFHRNETQSLFEYQFNGRKYKGLALYLLEYFTTKHNLTLGWLDVSQFGAKYPGSACSTMMEFLSIGYAHLAPLECSLSSEHLPLVEPVNPTYIYKLKVIVPKGQLIPPLSLLGYCFQRAVWVYTVAIITVTTFAWFILNTRKSIFTAASDVVIIFSSACWLNIKKVSSLSQRLLVAVCLLTANVVLITAFQCTLVSLLTSGIRYHPIDTLEKLVHSNVRIQMDMKYVKTIFGSNEMDATIKRVASRITPKLNFEPMNEIINLVSTRKTAVILSLRQTPSAQSAVPWLYETVHIIHESLTIMALSYTHRSNSVFKTPFKAMVDSLLEAGIIVSLEQELNKFVSVAMIRNPQSEEFHLLETLNKESGRLRLVKSVSLKDAALAFSVLFIGLFVSFLVFVAERILNKYLKSRTRKVITRF